MTVTKHKLTVCKAKPEEFKRVRGFVNAMENLLDTRSFFDAEEDWKDWPKGDPDRKLMDKIVKELDDEASDNRLVVYEFMKRKFREANYGGSIGRILFNCETLIQNCCDPKLDHLEFKPSIMYAQRDALLKVQKQILSGEKRGRSAESILNSLKKWIDKQISEDD